MERPDYSLPGWVQAGGISRSDPPNKPYTIYHRPVGLFRLSAYLCRHDQTWVSGERSILADRYGFSCAEEAMRDAENRFTEALTGALKLLAGVE